MFHGTHGRRQVHVSYPAACPSHTSDPTLSLSLRLSSCEENWRSTASRVCADNGVRYFYFSTLLSMNMFNCPYFSLFTGISKCIFRLMTDWLTCSQTESCCDLIASPTPNTACPQKGDEVVYFPHGQSLDVRPYNIPPKWILVFFRNRPRGIS